jgi:hypothetical protein
MVSTPVVDAKNKWFVIPAKAGIQLVLASFPKNKMDYTPLLRRALSGRLRRSFRHPSTVPLAQE